MIYIYQLISEHISTHQFTSVFTSGKTQPIPHDISRKRHIPKRYLTIFRSNGANDNNILRYFDQTCSRYDTIRYATRSRLSAKSGRLLQACMILKVLMNMVLMSVRERDRTIRTSRDHKISGVLRDKMLGVLREPDRTLVAYHLHPRYDDNKSDDPNTNETNNRLQRQARHPDVRSQPALILPGFWPGQWTPLDVPTSTESRTRATMKSQRQ